jgi:ATP-dependent Clp protease ATP-binding subunit ClpC
MTSNLGTTEINEIKSRIGFGDVSKLTKKKKEGAINKALKNLFRPEFLNRLDGVLVFNDIDKEQAYKIIKLRFDVLNEWVSSKFMQVEYDQKVVDYLYKKGFSKEYGARPLKRAMKVNIMLPLSKKLLEEHFSKEDTIVRIGIKSNEVYFDFYKSQKTGVADDKPAESVH